MPWQGGEIYVGSIVVDQHSTVLGFCPCTRGWKTRGPQGVCATSLYGVSDLETFAKSIHKFESRYLDHLIDGCIIDVPEVYRKQYLINHAGVIVIPLLVSCTIHVEQRLGVQLTLYSFSKARLSRLYPRIRLRRYIRV